MARENRLWGAERIRGELLKLSKRETGKFGTCHLEATLGEYVAYFNASRPHQGLKQRMPVGSATVEDGATGTVSAISILGGLRHDYRRAA